MVTLHRLVMISGVMTLCFTATNAHADRFDFDVQLQLLKTSAHRDYGGLGVASGRWWPWRRVGLHALIKSGYAPSG
jgi:hypothetical protein